MGPIAFLVVVFVLPLLAAVFLVAYAGAAVAWRTLGVASLVPVALLGTLAAAIAWARGGRGSS